MGSASLSRTEAYQETIPQPICTLEPNPKPTWCNTAASQGGLSAEEFGRSSKHDGEKKTMPNEALDPKTIELH